MDAKWLYLTPMQWASEHGNDKCVKACATAGAKLRAVPVGRGGAGGDASRSANRLQPTPAKRPRRRRGSASTKATDGDTSPTLWGGHEWVRRSLLAVLLTRGSTTAKQLKEQYPCLKGLAAALRQCLYNNTQHAPPALPASTVASISLRPAIQLRRADPDPNLHSRVCAQRRARAHSEPYRHHI